MFKPTLFVTTVRANWLNNEAQNTIYPIILANFVNIFSNTGIKQSQPSQPIQHNKGKNLG